MIDFFLSEIVTPVINCELPNIHSSIDLCMYLNATFDLLKLQICHEIGDIHVLENELVTNPNIYKTT